MGDEVMAGTTSTSNAPETGGSLKVSALHRRFADYFDPRPALYWADMLLSTALGWGTFAAILWLPAGHPLKVLLWAVCVLAMYRAVLFIHELSHLRRGAVPGLETVWTLIVGLPFLVPSLMYVGPHNDHHRRMIFGTEEDPEYEPMATWSPLRIAMSGLALLFVQPLLVLRWGVLGPLSWVIPPLRKVVVEQASSLIINPAYRRKFPTGNDRTRWRLQEGGFAVWVWLMVAAYWYGYLPTAVIVQCYWLTASILMINHVRTLAAHRYISDGAPMDGVGQLLDSVNLEGNYVTTALAAPVGLRFHALHHLLPSMPYHNLGAVLRALRAELPADSPYHRAGIQGIASGLYSLFYQARRGGSGGEGPSLDGPQPVEAG